MWPRSGPARRSTPDRRRSAGTRRADGPARRARCRALRVRGRGARIVLEDVTTRRASPPRGHRSPPSNARTAHTRHSTNSHDSNPGPASSSIPSSNSPRTKPTSACPALRISTSTAILAGGPNRSGSPRSTSAAPSARGSSASVQRRAPCGSAASENSNDDRRSRVTASSANATYASTAHDFRPRGATNEPIPLQLRTTQKTHNQPPAHTTGIPGQPPAPAWTGASDRLANAVAAGDCFLPSVSVLEDEAIVVEQFALEADLVGAHAGGEREAEVGAREPAWQQPELE